MKTQLMAAVWMVIATGLFAAILRAEPVEMPGVETIAGLEKTGLKKTGLKKTTATDTFAAHKASMDMELAALRRRLEAVETRPLADSRCVCPGLTVRVDYLNWGLSRRGVDYAISTDDSALAVGSGVVHNLEFDRDSGVRGALAYQMATGWELSFSYTYFHTTGDATVREPMGGNLWAPHSHPSRNLEARTAAASGSFDYNVYDLEVNYTLLTNNVARLRMLGGLRWADIGQELRFAYDGRDFEQGLISNPVHMNGFGVRLGLEGEWKVHRDWSLFGRGAGSVLNGNFSSRILETNRSGIDTIVDVFDDYEQAVPVAEAALGISWKHNWLEFDAGYEVTSWFNLGDRSLFVDDADAGAYAPLADDILLDGWFLRCAVLF